MKPHITYFNRITKGQNSTQFKLYISREMNTEKNQNYFKISSFADGHLGCFQYLAMRNPSFCDSLVEIHMKSSTLSVSLSDYVTFVTIYYDMVKNNNVLVKKMPTEFTLDCITVGKDKVGRPL